MRNFITALLSLIITTSLFASPIPRQKVTLLGKMNGKSPLSFTVVELEKFTKVQKITIHDPYNKNIKTTFDGFYLEELVKKFAQTGTTKIKVKAIDGYQIDISNTDVSKAKLFLSYKDETGYLSVERMGPARIIAPFEGILSKDLLLTLGVNWVWKVKSIEFI